MKWFDLPPIWLAAAAVGTWFARGDLGRLSFDNTIFDWIGGAIVLVGLVLMALAIIRMRQHKTTVVPHMEPDALVSDGVFQLTRNPIYVSDALVLIGLILRWNAPLAIPLVFLFIIIIEKRFILGEEARLRAHFGEKFDEYAQKTRRWI